MDGDIEAPDLRIPSRVDVLVLGAGAAGLACAIGLASRGHRILVVTRRPRPTIRIGESLAPTSRPLLQELGAWELFLADGPVPCHANVSAWGSDDLRCESFLVSPWGNGWHVDRRRFNETLSGRAAELGVPCVELREAPRITGRGDPRGWRLEAGRVTVQARYLVDATGRASWLARRMGVHRRREDRQIALVALLGARREPDDEGTTLVEAVTDGWWYVAVLPGGQLATVYVSDPDLVDRRSPSRKVFFSLVAQTTYVRKRIFRHGLELLANPTLVPAGGARLERSSGNGWLAVGDAAICYDPLSGHGTTAALAAGVDAAAAIADALDGRGAAVEGYADRLRTAYDEYLRMRQQIYAVESRWPRAPFWARRQSGGPRTEL